MIRRTLHILLTASVLLLIGCKDELKKIYSRPSWLAGKIYTQIASNANLSEFAKCLRLTGYDTIINISGSYTAFAPTNDAFALYFQQNANYKKIEDIPLDELTKMVKYHIIQDAWSKDQLRELDVYGWIDTTDINNDKPRGYKRETLLREKDYKFGLVQNIDKSYQIVDTLASNWHRTQTTDARKYAPIFYQQYFDIYHLNTSDYTFYFNRPFESASDIYYVNGKLIQDEIFAENGFIHIIDRVIEPLQNARQILSDTKVNNYSKFLNLVNNFPQFTYNQKATFDQPGARQGLAVDSLYDVYYPNLTMSITNELTNAPTGTFDVPGNVTIRYHYGLVAPNNAAMDDFVGQYLVGPGRWGSLAEAPLFIRRIIANTHMSAYPIYQTNLNKGFTNGEEDIVTVSASDIIQKQYASNCTFIGTSKVIVPRAFKSVTGPVYLQKGYSTVMYAIESSGLLPALKRENQHYMFYVESDKNLAADSSLIYSKLNGSFTSYQISRGSTLGFTLNTNDLRLLLMNHIGTENPTGLGRKEFIKNLAGNYIVYNNVTAEVKGTSQTVHGFRGATPVTDIPTQISDQADNGITSEVESWFSFAAPSLYNTISTRFPKFQSLLKKAGLTKDKLYVYTFISDNQNYTVFAPNDAALASYNSDTLTTKQLQQFLMMHFVQGNMIFTDGHLPSNYYETARIDDSSTPYSIVNSKIYLEPGIDVINVSDNSGGIYFTIDESSKTNIITGRELGTGTEPYPNIVSNGVIHEINSVFLYNKMKIQ